MLSDFLESEEFYNMMQSYRFCPIGYPQEVKDRFEAIKAAIEAAVLPEGWVAVPKEPTLAMLDCLRSGITSNLEKRYQAMIAAAPQSAQASPLDLMECLQDRPVEPSKAVQGKCVTQAEKQEPVKDEPVAYLAGMYRSVIEGKAENTPLGVTISFINMGWKNQIELYTHPQPDLVAAVERLRYELKETREAYINQSARVVLADQRIAALEEAAREARDALQYKLHVVEAIAKLDAVLGNRRKYGD